MKISSLILSAVLLGGGASTLLLAEGPGGDNSTPVHAVRHHHARRRQVNRRLKRQLQRIRAKERKGEITRTQAAARRKNVKGIHQEETDMAAQDDGHITKQDQGSLNQQLNQNSKDIKNP